MMHAHTSRFDSRLDYLPKSNTKIRLSPRWKAKFKEFNQYLIENKRIQKRKQQAKAVLFNAIGLCISLLIVITAFEWKFYDNNDLINLGSLNSEFEEILDVPITEQPPPPPPKMQAVNILEVPDVEEIEEELDIVLDVEVTEETALEDVVFDPDAYNEAEEEVEEVFLFVEQAPTPKGGMKSFYDYVAQNLEYPVTARRMRIEGKVYIQFIINKDGSLTDFQILKGIGGGCDEEAIRVLKTSPKWNAGKQRGRPVKVKMSLPIMFVLE
jgi:protein TonB